MSESETFATRYHLDSAQFVEALRFTAMQKGFPARLIEKDYFCSVLLEYLTGRDESLVFKGGTCLTKVYAGFYRLSEDLDFVIPMPVDATRQDRSRWTIGIKRAVNELHRTFDEFQVVEPFRGANNSMQYLGTVAYRSLLSDARETIKIDVGLREPLLMEPEKNFTQTILLDPISNQAAVTPIQLRCISLTEAFAEKFRAALSRREVAIRDFFDIDYAVRTLGLQIEDDDLIALVRRKLRVPGNEPVDVSDKRLSALRQQVEPQLRSVLRAQDFTEFDLERAFGMVADMAGRVSVRV